MATDINDLEVVGIARTMIDEIERTAEARSFDEYSIKHSLNKDTLPRAIFNQITRFQNAISSHTIDHSSVDCLDSLASSLALDEILTVVENISDAFRSPVERLLNFETYTSESQQQGQFDDFQSLQLAVKRFVLLVRTFVNQGAFIITKSGNIGFAPDSSMPGDIIVAFDGAETPSVLRGTYCTISCKPPGDKASGESKISYGNQGWQLVGECYLHNFMNNEILQPEFHSQRQAFFLL